MGLYVPGYGQDDFRFYVAIFGLAADTQCERWGDGWGRRLEGEEVSATVRRGRALAHPRLPVHRYTSDGTTWLADSYTSLIPPAVVGNGDEGYPVNYTDPASRLVFIADPDGDLPNKFEPFSPTLFRPRGSCITDLPHAGEYRIAVWSDDTQTAPRKFSVGLGLAERDVFSPRSLLLFDFTLLQIQAWNGWSPAVLLLPIVLALLVLFAALFCLKSKAPSYFGTASGWPTPFRLLAAIGGTIYLGHVVANIMLLVWAVTSAEAHNEFIFPMVTQILLPMLNGTYTLLIGLRVPLCCCCCPGKPSPTANCGVRLALLPAAILHLMLHAGYIVGPLSLLVAAVLPPSCANKGALPADAPASPKISAAKGEKAKPSATSAAEVDPTPPVMSTL